MLKKADEKPESKARELASDLVRSLPVMRRGLVTGVVTFVSVQQARADLGCEPTGEWQAAAMYEYKLAPAETLEAAAEELSR